MKYREVRPGPDLLPFVECLWQAWDRDRWPREPQRILPDGCPELIVHLGDRFSRLRSGRWSAQPRAFLAGTLSRPWLVRGGRHVCTLGVRFRPATAAGVLAVRLDNWADRETALASLVGARRSARLLARLREAATMKGRFAALEAWLKEGLAPRAQPAQGLARRAVGVILDSRGQVRMTDLAERCQATARQLERAFARELGIRPKLFARIVRLNAFLERSGEGTRERMVDLALDAG
ncbi:MAG TPA: DUF6597 domain-containing transcriptional factor, partial [Vicinamibacteria bacterium]